MESVCWVKKHVRGEEHPKASLGLRLRNWSATKLTRRWEPTPKCNRPLDTTPPCAYGCGVI
jgi:hypothetical protein